MHIYQIEAKLSLSGYHIQPFLAIPRKWYHIMIQTNTIQILEINQVQNRFK